MSQKLAKSKMPMSLENFFYGFNLLNFGALVEDHKTLKISELENFATFKIHLRIFCNFGPKYLKNP